MVEITFPNPYVPYAPTVVTIRANEAGSPVRKEIPVSHQEAFRREWLHFFDCVREGAPTAHLARRTRERTSSWRSR